MLLSANWSLGSIRLKGNGERSHFDKYVFNLPIARFGEEATHFTVELAQAAKIGRRPSQAIRLTLREGEYFTRTRKRIRDALTEHGIVTRLEELAALIF